MSHTILFEFDTLTYANELKAVGVPEKQAEVQVHKLAETLKEQNKAINELIENDLATKKDIKELETKLEFKIEGIKKDMKELESKIVIKLVSILGSLIVGCFGILGTLIVIFQK